MTLYLGVNVDCSWHKSMAKKAHFTLSYETRKSIAVLQAPVLSQISAIHAYIQTLPTYANLSYGISNLGNLKKWNNNIF